MKACAGYVVELTDDGRVRVTCAVCGPSVVTLAGAAQLIDPLIGLTGPLGRFLINGSREVRADLARKIAAVLPTGAA